ncbi:MAG: sigma-70 family RNA polymerase sigma factor [Bacteroidetes bacterium]|nr:sigma-70 family RNA polymerase sigma factor [Bacteroidota bacterium]
MNDEIGLIEQLKYGNDLFIKQFYNDNREKFINYFLKRGLNKDEALDMYQDAVIILFEKAKQNKLNDIKCSVSTYLFGIGKFIFLKIKKKKHTLAIAADFEMIDTENILLDNEIKHNILMNNFELLGEQCKKVLQLFYFEEKKLDEIQIILDYSNKEVLKSQKSRCLKQLKELIQKQ